MENIKTILYIDDEPDLRMLAKLVLEMSGRYAVVESNSGREALQQLESLLPDLILLDVMMPEMDGLETLDHIKSMPRTRDVPVIFLTAKVNEEDIRLLRSRGAVDVLAKPFDPAALADQIDEIWKEMHE